MSRFLEIDIITNICPRFTGKALKDFTEGSLSLKPESISYCNEIQAKFDDDGDLDDEYKGRSPEEKLLFFWILSK